MIKKKKDNCILLRISSDEYDVFKSYCKSINITVSCLLRLYIASCIVKYKTEELASN